MHVKAFRVKNFRRLKDIRVDLHPDTSIFVGANNSGKTSATHIFQLFLGDSKGNFSINDFTTDCWSEIRSIDPASADAAESLPEIEFDLWFDVDDPNVHRVVEFLPSLSWEGPSIGVRFAFRAKDGQELLQNYLEAREKATRTPVTAGSAYQPWPSDLLDYLRKRLDREYEIVYFVLDSAHFDSKLTPTPDCDPYLLGNASTGAAKLVDSLIRVDFLDAQRHLVDGDSRGRHEDLSKRLTRYYARNLTKLDDDIDALAAIAASEERLNEHFMGAFEPVFKSLRELGYPGLGNHELVVKADFNPTTILNSNAYVHYALPYDQESDSEVPTLPDRYNGLGFKNLIYMAVEILDFHHAWDSVETDQPPVHLLMIEEPESHLHAQLQQVFIRKVRDILPEAREGLETQLVVTTHSSHVIYESSFNNIRYFRRRLDEPQNGTSEVRNLSTFYDAEEPATREFLLQYLKLTHCDLFFADGALLVEGNVERLLLPLMIEKNCPSLRASRLTILEVGGAFAHKFDKLVAFLEIPTLVITDLDSVEPKLSQSGSIKQSGDPGNDDQDIDEDDTGSKCVAELPGAVTSNQTLRKWVPKLTQVSDLLDVDEAQKIALNPDGTPRNVRVAYQTPCTTSWRGTRRTFTGRTLEEAFAFENLAFCQEKDRKHLGLYIRDGSSLDVDAMRSMIFTRVKNLDKTRFALGLIAEDPQAWVTPQYIAEGLKWLQSSILPPDLEAPTSSVTVEAVE